MSQTFMALGFTGMDGFILFICVCASVLGSIADYVLRRDDFENLPAVEPVTLSWQRTIPLFTGRVLFIGAIAGVAVWLVFYGSMSATPAAHCKLFLLAGWAGFSAPQTAARIRRAKFPSTPATG